MNDFSKNRVLALYKILIKHTDEQHQISMREILGHMESEGYFCSEDSILRYIKQLRKDTNVRAILSYADSAFHNGYIYQATNFKYYGLTPKKRDFWFLLDDGSYKKCQRGKIKGAEGEYRDRSRKHRYLIIFDKTLKCKWEEQPYPKGDNKGEYNK
jgi:hypothetical protein